MNQTIYYSKKFNCLIIEPNMGFGVLINDGVVQVMGTYLLSQRREVHKDFKKIGACDA